MREEFGDLWDLAADARCITTNGAVRRDGAAVMGRGCALEAKQRHPRIEYDLGELIEAHGNHVHLLADSGFDAPIPGGWEPALVAFPVKHHWRQPADLTLIARSARELLKLADEQGWQRVLLPRPGAGNGRLQWGSVKATLAPILDERIVVVTWPSASTPTAPAGAGR